MNDEFDRDEPRRDSIRPSRQSPIQPSQRPPARRMGRDPYDDVPRSGGGGKIVLIIFLVLGLIGFTVLGLCGAGGYLLYRSVSQAGNRVRQAATRIATTNNYMRIAIAMQSYQSAHGNFPPVSMRTKSGKPGLSWRVAILPYLGEDQLYRQFKIDEPWDHPDNLRLANRMPQVYAAPNEPPGRDQTHVRVFFGRGGLFEPGKNHKFTDIRDGTSNTILIVESTSPTQWIQPGELPFDPNGALPQLGMPGSDHFLVAMADGSVKMIKKSISPEKVKAAITIDGGERVFLDE